MLLGCCGEGSEGAAAMRRGECCRCSRGTLSKRPCATGTAPSGSGI